MDQDWATQVLSRPWGSWRLEEREEGPSPAEAQAGTDADAARPPAGGTPEGTARDARVSEDVLRRLIALQEHTQVGLEQLGGSLRSLAERLDRLHALLSEGAAQEASKLLSALRAEAANIRDAQFTATARLAELIERSMSELRAELEGPSSVVVEEDVSRAGWTVPPPTG